jgi:uncharacterized protein YbjQ (UPF0145 family)
MIVTTTGNIEGKPVKQYLGVVAGEAIYGANFIRDWFASIRDVVGGRAGSYQKVLASARNDAMREMIEQASTIGANAIIGVDVDYEVVGDTMLMVSVNGTAVKI